MINIKEPKGFKGELEELINRYNMEKMAGMPAFLLAEMIINFISMVGLSIKGTLHWYGCDATQEDKL
ncbi:MAG: hypothetical protein J7K15_12150 [Deltaproteobacteria bacterium]|nr:hypothetical protein [Deltaproteobacteria bacterium]